MNAKNLWAAGIVLLAGCGEQAQETPAPVEETAAIEEESYRALVGNVRGGAFLESVTVDGDSATNSYYDSYAAYEAAGAGDVTEETYRAYFESGDAIEKLLFDSTAYLLDKEPRLQELTVDFQYNGEDYSYTIDRASAAPYIGGDSAEDEMRQGFLLQTIGKPHIDADNAR